MSSSFSCEEANCSFSATFRSHLMVHKAVTHWLQKRFSCALCSGISTFASEAAATRHIFKEHILKVDNCSRSNNSKDEQKKKKKKKTPPPPPSLPLTFVSDEQTDLIRDKKKVPYVQVDRDFLPFSRAIASSSSTAFVQQVSYERCKDQEHQDLFLICNLCGELVEKNERALIVHAKATHLKRRTDETRKWVCRSVSQWPNNDNNNNASWEKVISVLAHHPLSVPF